MVHYQKVLERKIDGHSEDCLVGTKVEGRRLGNRRALACPGQLRLPEENCTWCRQWEYAGTK